MGYLDDIKAGAIAGWREHKILPSLTASQAIIESGWGKSKLAQPPYNNQFGIKASADWTGRTVNMQTCEYGPQGSYWINADFRAYDSMGDSVKDHAAFFSNTEWRRNNYRHVIGEKDYKTACIAVQKAGYATDPGYANSLIRVIEEHKLYEWDKEAFNASAPPSTQPEAQEEPKASKTTDKTVGDTLTRQTAEELTRFSVTLIGDQQAVGTRPYIDGKFKSFTYTARNGMTLTNSDSNLSAVNVVRTMKTNNTLKDYVVLVVGTNGSVDRNGIDEVVKQIGVDRKLLLVDTTAEVAHRASVAQEYYSASIRHDNVYYVNWTKYSEPYITNFYTGAVGSRITMTSEGYHKHAEYIMQAVFESSAGVFDGRHAQLTSKKHFGIEELDYSYKGMVSPKGQSVMYNPSANEKWGFRAGTGGKPLWIDGLFELPGETNKHILAYKAYEYLEEHSKPAVQYRVHLSELPNTVSIGDRGTFIDHYFNPPLAIEATVIEITTSDTDPSSNTVVIGNVEVMDYGANDEIEAIRRKLERVRQEVISEYRKGAPIELITEASSGLILSEDATETTIRIKAIQNGFNVTDRYTYLWERYTSDTQADKAYNAKLLETHRSPYMRITQSDLHNNSAQFVVRAYDEDGNLSAMGGADIRYIQRGKSAYESAVENGYRGTETEWLQSLKGDPGEQGLPGAKGADGKPSYTHIAWANGTQGEGFSTSVSLNKRYMGVYIDDKPEDSADHTKYKWSLIQGPAGPQGQRGLDGIQGPQGQQGIPGTKGADGRTSYTHIAYANSADGRNAFSLSDSNRTYIGMYVDFTQSDSTEPTRYKWTRAKGADGAQGIPGTKGTDGRTPYLHIAYADNETGTQGFSTTTSAGKKYIGTYTDFTQTDSTNPRQYKWLKLAQAYAEEFKVELDNKANQRETDEYLNHIRGELQKQSQQQEALASMQALNEVVKNVQLLREAFERDGQASAEKLLQAVNKLAKIENDLGEFAFRLNAINLVMQFSDEGFVIGNKTKGTYILITDDEIGLFNNGEQVAFIKGGTLQFVQGIFIERVQIGAYMLGAYEEDPEILALRYVGRGNN